LSALYSIACYTGHTNTSVTMLLRAAGPIKRTRCSQLTTDTTRLQIIYHATRFTPLASPLDAQITNSMRIRAIYLTTTHPNHEPVQA